MADDDNQVTAPDTLTSFNEVAYGYQPPVPASDTDTVYDLIDEAETILEARLGDLQEWIDARGPAQAARREKLLKRVVKRMVRRVLRNPEGFVGETEGDYSYTRHVALRSGQVYASSADWSLLGISTRRARSIRLGLPADSPRNMHGFRR